MPAQIANGMVCPPGVPVGTKAAALGEMEREGATAKVGAGKVGAAKAGAAPAAAQTQAVAAQGAGTKVVAAQGAGAKAAAVGVGKVGVGAKTVGGTIWSGKGLALGLGMGLGAWGPLILGVVGAGAVYAYMKSRDIEAAQSDEEVELRDALS
ncbi:magnetic particle specific iron-binding protein Mms6 [Magnetospirillum moscoviense]|uniref:Magnetic particle specific iron-binding protein n=1 Tax=Magnetospirillum moscoviense TaxID=1437059 RepID=A0A178ME58_9PROT|nr:magnetic particle specific iron-binding protein Mms6 [Magnetospirillum moscoviense]OAN46295.1 magnetic particle specific iron-binding protein [Magnetospirillum moscoviense]